MAKTGGFGSELQRGSCNHYCILCRFNLFGLATYSCVFGHIRVECCRICLVRMEESGTQMLHLFKKMIVVSSGNSRNIFENSVKNGRHGGDGVVAYRA